MARYDIRKTGRATRFTADNPRPGPGRPRTKIVREYARKIAEERDPKTKRLIAEQLVRALVKSALKGSLGHFQQFLQLLESDAPCDSRWPGNDTLTPNATAKLIEKLCRR